MFYQTKGALHYALYEEEKEMFMSNEELYRASFDFEPILSSFLMVCISISDSLTIFLGNIYNSWPNIHALRQT